MEKVLDKRARLVSFIESSIESVFLEDEKDFKIWQAASYSLESGGKYLRSLFILAVAEALGLPKERLISSIQATELIHTATLIHDDLPALDDDDFRRGRKACHLVFGEAHAILAADAMFARAIKCLSSDSQIDSESRISLINNFTTAIELVCEGQVLDICSRVDEIEYEDLVKRHKLKTAALFKAAILSPLIIDKSGEKVSNIKDLAVFADVFGLWFQVTDDLLGIREEQHLTGKNSSSDINKGTQTFVSLLGKEKAEEIRSELERQSLEILARINLDTPFIKQLLLEVASRL